MKKISKKIKRSFLGLTTLMAIGSAFGLGVYYSKPVQQTYQKAEEWSTSKTGISVYSGVGGALIFPTLLVGSYRLLTRKRRKLKQLEIQEKKLRIKELEQKQEREE